MILGLTGGYCAGKNAVAAILEKRGILVLDVDRTGHEALALCAGKLAEAFGPDVLRADGTPDRARLGAIVFSDARALALHESIVHPAMFALVDAFLERNADRARCLNAAILYAMPQAGDCDLILEVRAPFLVRLRRCRERDGKGLGDFLKRLASQRRFSRLARTCRGKIRIVRNASGLDALERRLDRILGAADGR